MEPQSVQRRRAELRWRRGLPGPDLLRGPRQPDAAVQDILPGRANLHGAEQSRALQVLGGLRLGTALLLCGPPVVAGDVRLQRNPLLDAAVPGGSYAGGGATGED